MGRKLKIGEVLAFKTDTVWGFGVNCEDETAICNIYKIKKRDFKKPLILMSNNFSHLEKYVEKIPNYAYKLIEKYLPGGLTLIFKKSKYCLNSISSVDTVGIRVPNSEDFKMLIDSLNSKVLATTSCNLSSESPVLNYIEANKKFSNVATIIKPIKDEDCVNIPSTVILCQEDDYKILRQGSVLL